MTPRFGGGATGAARSERAWRVIGRREASGSGLVCRDGVLSFLGSMGLLVGWIVRTRRVLPRSAKRDPSAGKPAPPARPGAPSQDETGAAGVLPPVRRRRIKEGVGVVHSAATARLPGWRRRATRSLKAALGATLLMRKRYAERGLWARKKFLTCWRGSWRDVFFRSRAECAGWRSCREGCGARRRRGLPLAFSHDLPDPGQRTYDVFG